MQLRNFCPHNAGTWVVCHWALTFLRNPAESLGRRAGLDQAWTDKNKEFETYGNSKQTRNDEIDNDGTLCWYSLDVVIAVGAGSFIKYSGAPNGT